MKLGLEQRDAKARSGREKGGERSFGENQENLPGHCQGLRYAVCKA